MHAGPGGAWTLVVPVKRFIHAKSRLAPFAGSFRAPLARAMALDSVAAMVGCAQVGEVVVVTDDHEARRALTTAGVVVVPDEPDSGLNAALRHGATFARHRRNGPVAAISADLPALDPTELGLVLAAAEAHPVSFVADVAGTGTTAYCTNGRATFAPLFGVGSADRHRQAGATPLPMPGVRSVRQDVDTEEDLDAARRLGVGPHTRSVLAQLGSGAGPDAGPRITIRS